jgi:hypothetical protein
MTASAPDRTELCVNGGGLAIALLSALAAFVWNPLYGPYLWALAAGAVVLTAIVAIVLRELVCRRVKA